MTNPLLFLLICMLGYGCTHAPKVTHLNWLAGSWEHREGDRITRETWSNVETDMLVGQSATTERGAELFSEELSIVDSNGVLVYVAVLPFKTALFTMDSIAEEYVRFVDPSNDFPSSITYQRNENRLAVTLSGNQDGTPVREVLSFILVGQ